MGSKNNDTNNKKRKKLLKLGVWTFVIVVAFTVFAYILGIVLSKYTLSIIVTNSMYPTIPENTYAIMANWTDGDVNVGDIVLFDSDYAINVVHRVIEIGIDEDGDKYYITRGDNNNKEDIGVRYRWDIRKKVVKIFDNNKLEGKIVSKIAGNTGAIYIAVVVCSITMAILIWYKILLWAAKKIKEKIIKLCNAIKGYRVKR